MNEPFDTVEYKGYTIKLHTDDSPESPRTWDNVGTMICFHKRYDLGDKTTLRSCDFNGWDELEKHLVRVEEAIDILPVFMYDHSGITIKTTPFGCRWDSGQIGFIYTTRKRVKEFLNIKKLTKNSVKRIRDILIEEVETYDSYLTGEVCGFVVGNKDDDNIDSCWGFYSSQDAIAEAKGTIDCLIQEKIKKNITKLKTYIKHKVPLAHRVLEV